MKLLGKTIIIVILLLFVLNSVLIIFNGYNSISFAYTFLFYATLCILLVITLKKVFKVQSKLAVTVIISIFFSVFILEVGLKYVLKRNLTYAEINKSPFYSTNYIHSSTLNKLLRKRKFKNMANYMVHQPNASVNISNSEFSYDFNYNSLGLRNEEISLAKKQGEHRVIALGDSFTEGFGAPKDSTWPALFEHTLRTENNLNINCINAGVANSDPIYSLKLLEDKLIDYKPDLVILAINGSDIRDVFLRGGPERYDSKGNLHFKTGPWWEFFYGTSFIVRYIIHDILNYNEYLVKSDSFLKSYAESQQLLNESILKMNSFCEENNIDFRVVFTPFFTDIFNGYLDLDKTYHYLVSKNMLSKIIYLPPCYYQNFQYHGSNPMDYYWPIDFHHNSEGYLMMAHCIIANMNYSF